MTDEPNQLPVAWWRRAAARIDGIDVLTVWSVAVLCVGLVLLFGLGVMLTVAGGLGLAFGVVATASREAEARRRERRLWA